MSDAGSRLAQSIHDAGMPLSGERVVADTRECPANRCRHGAKPHPADPGYVHACHEQRWKLATWRKSNPTEIQWRPARCYSWRHDGPCRRHKAAEDYSRIKEALANVPREAVTYAVLTLDPSAWTKDGWAKIPKKSGKIEKRPRREGAKENQAAIGASYRALADRWHHLATSLRREYGKFSYVSTVEQHRSGWPHLNVIFVNQEIADHVKAEGKKLYAWGRKSKGREVAKRVFGDLLVQAGFGHIAFAELALERGNDGEDRLAAYIAKLAGDPSAAWDGEKRGLLSVADDAPAGVQVESIEGHTVAEIAKYSQAPTRAPSHFRRLRSSKGFLPPKRRDEDVTGELFDEGGRPVAGDPVERIRKAAMTADTYEACEHVMRQASKLEDKWRDRENEVGLAFLAAQIGKKLDDSEIKTPKQAKIAHRIREVMLQLAKKIEGEPVDWSTSSAGGAAVAPAHPLAPMEGVTIRTSADCAKWIGPLGPGMGGEARKYRLTIGQTPHAVFSRDP